MDIPVGIAIALGGGLSAYWVNRLVDRDRASKLRDEMRDWVEEKYVPREVLDSKLDSINNRLGDIDKRTSRMHNENTSKLDHLLAIVSALSGLGGMAVKPRRTITDDDV